MGINSGAYPERNDTTIVMITLTDINDHSPQFTENVYSTSVLEGTAMNTPLLIVNSTDLDEPNVIESTIIIRITNHQCLHFLSPSLLASLLSFPLPSLPLFTRQLILSCLIKLPQLCQTILSL